MRQQQVQRRHRRAPLDELVDTLPAGDRAVRDEATRLVEKINRVLDS